jgi:hypothetical protein
MLRAIRYGTIIGALLLSAACDNSSEAPGESSFIPRPNYVSVQSAAASMTTKVTGFVYDPEAFFLSIATCQNCPFPPLLLDNSPLFLRSVVVGTTATIVDPATGKPAQVQTATTDGTGTYTIKGLPTREDDQPYLPFAPGGQGSLIPIPFPPVPIPPANYLPTLSLHPLYSASGGCYGFETFAMGDNGILEAVAKYLTLVENNPTTVADFINPAKYQSVVVFWHMFPGFVYLRAPADGLTVEASAGRVINVIWAPPGALPPQLDPLRSTRNFVVIPGAPTSALGISVALLPASSSPPATVTYQMKDGTTDANLLRPWRLPPLKVTPSPGVISYVGAQVDYSNSLAVRTISPASCLQLSKY